MTANARKYAYVAMAALNVALFFSAQENLFANAPHIAYCVALASAYLGAFMHAWGAPDASPAQAAVSVLAAPPSAPSSAAPLAIPPIVHTLAPEALAALQALSAYLATRTPEPAPKAPGAP